MPTDDLLCSPPFADIDALDLLKQELKEDDHEKVISAISRIDVIGTLQAPVFHCHDPPLIVVLFFCRAFVVAISLGPERSRNELLPFLKGTRQCVVCSSSVRLGFGFFCYLCVCASCVVCVCLRSSPAQTLRIRTMMKHWLV